MSFKFRSNIREEAEREEQTGGLLPEDEYRIECRKVELKVSSSGNDMWELELAVIDHERYEGKTLRHWLVFSPKTEANVYKTLTAFGVPHDRLINEFDVQRSTEWLLLASCYATVKHESRKNDETGEVKTFAKVPFFGFHAKPLAERMAEKAAAGGGNAKGSSGASGSGSSGGSQASSPSSSRASAAVADDDDLPF